MFTDPKMTQDRVFHLKNNPRRNIARDLTHQNTLRVFRNTPETVHLQMRRTKDYIGISLSFAEARLIATALIEACSE